MQKETMLLKPFIQENIKRIQQESEFQNLVYGKDYQEEDLIVFERYFNAKEKRFYKPVLKLKPWIHIKLQETEISLFYKYRNAIQQKHSLFHQKIKFDALNKIDFKNININPIFKTHWSHLQNREKMPGLYLQGDCNTGKTFFLKIIMKYFINHRKDFLFLFMAELPRLFKNNNWHDENLNLCFDILKETPYLFLDDLGGENLTAYFRDDILYPILNARCENGLSTFISSNYNVYQLKQHLKLSHDEKEDIKALRIINKLKKMCQFCGFNSNDNKKRLWK